MTGRKVPPTEFGKRLAAIRKSRGLTQVELAEEIGSNQRLISYYEGDKGHAPAPVLIRLAEALNVTTDELLGVKTPKIEKTSAAERRLWKRFQQLLELPEKEQQSVLRMVTALSEAQEVRKKARKRKRRARVR